MSLNKAIEHGKEHRRPYIGSKRFDKTCRNHGSCDWCRSNRKHKFRDKHKDEECIDTCDRYTEYLSMFKDPDDAFANLERDCCATCNGDRE